MANTAGATLESHLHDLFPARWPVPPSSCETCRGRAVTRKQARAAGDMSLVSDMNVLIRRHHPQVKR